MCKLFQHESVTHTCIQKCKYTWAKFHQLQSEQECVSVTWETETDSLGWSTADCLQNTTRNNHEIQNLDKTLSTGACDTQFVIFTNMSVCTPNYQDSCETE